ncbi:cytochrome c-550 PedF [Actibacterium sp. 188UL27-1]|uniref:cytochrome c-550 PedF n=1 Tax=Actibacterium sp. 188UL27-1 TaxID=2786961 RepID=UPI00195AA514|nr:cytochrome c-550 PedF [Actibacterium sp. 188UL27-1]MBM7066413.1 cytochrome c-550 PedF [Actibacterium sp. 188UL27-1]
MSIRSVFAVLTLAAGASFVHAHGDVAPQPVNTDALPALEEEWLIENPYRADAVGEDVWKAAVDIGASGYNQNCARCHGLEAISGGLAPDLRFLEAEEYGDEWYVERFREGYTQNGITKMPAFGELLGQEAAWAIRTYIETRPDDQAIVDVAGELKEMRDQLAAWGSTGEAGDVEALKTRMSEIAGEIETLSGAPVADSVAYRAAAQIDDTPASLTKAAQTLTVGLSAAN